MQLFVLQKKKKLRLVTLTAITVQKSKWSWSGWIDGMEHEKGNARFTDIHTRPRVNSATNRPWRVMNRDFCRYWSGFIITDNIVRRGASPDITI
jgi:hypothetical protein